MISKTARSFAASSPLHSDEKPDRLNLFAITMRAPYIFVVLFFGRRNVYRVTEEL